jgi:hypothetical protein
MDKRIASLLLVCLVVFSINYGCSLALSSHAAHSIDVVPSRSITVTEGSDVNTDISNTKPNMRMRILGDLIDDPTPH